MPAIIRGKGIYGFVDATSLFSRGHTVYNWHAKIGAETKIAAMAEAPVRTGAMRASVYFTMPDHSRGPRTKFLEIKIGARRKYSRFVHEGTTGPITAKNPNKRMGPIGFPPGASGYQGIPRGESPYKRRGKVKRGQTKFRLSRKTEAVGFSQYMFSVSGQDANPFLARALDKVALRHRWRPGRTRVF